LKFGLIGAGAIAQAYSHAFQQTDGIRVVGVADVRREAADAMAATLECDAFASHEEMVDQTACDAAVVCTPPSTHPEICISLMDRGIHVLCEKPLAIDSRAARKMQAAADRSGVKFTMASKFRYVDDVVRAKSLVTSGVLGDILLFENCFTARVDMAGRWNSDPAVSGGGVLIDNGTHSVDIMRYFLGPLADLQVIEGKRHQGLQVEDTVRMFVRTPACVIGSIDLSWSMSKDQPYFISIYGSGGTLQVGWQESKYRRRGDDAWIQFGSGYDKLQAFRNQISNFAGAIRGEESLRITSDDALASVEVIEAAYEALRGSNWQQVAQSHKTDSVAVLAHGVLGDVPGVPML
jgi:predicted dehydrogenase